MDKLVSLCKRRGFIFQSSEIYGGTGSVWDYGPLGVELKKNLKDRWWHAMVRARDDIEGLDAAILMHPRVWEASGHVAGFTDPLVDCTNCKRRFRADDPEIKGTPGTPDAQCPACGIEGHAQRAAPCSTSCSRRSWGRSRTRAAVVYLRPETAQGIYVNFLNVQQSTRQKVPFGIAQIGKAFRNEITPGNFIFRTREFEQMEMQFFVEPGTDMEWFEYWKAAAHGLAPGARPRAGAAAVPPAHEGGARALRARGVRRRSSTSAARSASRRSRACTTAATSTSSQHQEYSGKKLEYFDQPNNKRYVPYVIETSVGADRTTLAVLVNAYREEAVRGRGRGAHGARPRIRRSRRSRPACSRW